MDTTGEDCVASREIPVRTVWTQLREDPELGTLVRQCKPLPIRFECREQMAGLDSFCSLPSGCRVGNGWISKSLRADQVGQQLTWCAFWKGSAWAKTFLPLPSGQGGTLTRTSPLGTVSFRVYPLLLQIIRESTLYSWPTRDPKVSRWFPTWKCRARPLAPDRSFEALSANVLTTP